MGEGRGTIPLQFFAVGSALHFFGLVDEMKEIVAP
jgi:hypothetical protein